MVSLASRASAALIFFPCGDAAPDVPLGLVHVQHLFHLRIQRPVELGQPLGDVLVDGSYKVER